MKRLFLLFPILVNSTSRAQSLGLFAKEMAGDRGARFESNSQLVCPLGMDVTMEGYFQFEENQHTGTGGVSRVKAKAPYIWLLNDERYDSVHIGFYSELRAEYIFCDDDGHEFTRQLTHPYIAVYNLSGEVSAPVVLRRDFLKIPGQSIGAPAISFASTMEEHLNAEMILNDPRIDGPADIWANISKDRPQLALTPISQSSFSVTFENACGNTSPLTVFYEKSICGLNGAWCP